MVFLLHIMVIYKNYQTIVVILLIDCIWRGTFALYSRGSNECAALQPHHQRQQCDQLLRGVLLMIV